MSPDTTPDAPPTSGAEWLTLTPRQMELMLWQLIADMGGELSTIPPDDKPTRKVLFYRDPGGYVGMISNEEFVVE
jgi:hypothetical protein